MIRAKPIPLIVSAWLAGVAWGIKSQLSLVYILTATVLLLLAQLIFHYSTQNKVNWRTSFNVPGLPSQLLLLMTIVLAGLCWGVGFKLWEQPQLPELQQEKTITVVGTVVSPVKIRSSGESFVLRTEQLQVNNSWIPIKELTEVISYDWELEHGLGYGDLVAVTGRVRIPSPPSNPNAFDYSSYLTYQRIYSQLILASAPESIEQVHPWHPVKLAQDYKRSSIATIMRLLPSEEGKALAAMTFGWRQGLSSQQQELYAKAGLLHLFAVSGMHMGFVLLGGIGLLSLVNINRYLSFIILVVLVAGYAAMADFSVSATRAGLMGILGLAFHLLQREKNFYTSISLVAFILTLVNPYYLYQVGFQLSFVATLGIAFLYPYLLKLGKEPVSWWQKGLAVSAAAQIAVTPILVYHFNMVSVIGLVMNVLATWLVAFCILIGLISYPISLLWGTLAEVFLIACGGGIYYLTLAAQNLVMLPGYTYVQAPSLLAILLYYLSLVYWVWYGSGSLELLGRRLFNWHYPIVGKALGISLIVCLIISWMPLRQAELEITVLDVGQGDAIFIVLPNSKTILIDGGGLPGPSDKSFDVGERVVVPFLKSKGINTIDLLINTHGHYDHVAGLIPVLKAFSVKQALISPVAANSKTYEEFLDLLLNRRIPTLEGKRGQTIHLDQRVNIQVLHPADPLRGTNSDLNENSIVIHLRYKDFTMLFSGDIELQAMGQLVEENVELTSTIYKIAHHGSKTGYHQEFLSRVRPQVAVIPVGRNSFGHPDTQLIELMEKLGAIVYRTDHHGGITIITDGKALRIETSSPHL